MSWFERWLEVQHEQGEMVCAAGKKPSQKKIDSFCWEKAEHGQGCPNLFPASGLEAKQGTIFGKRKYARPGVNVKDFED